MDEVRFGTGLAQRPDQPGGTQEVGLGGKVRRVVELDGGGRVDDDVAAEELLAAGLAEAETVPPEVDLEHRQLLGHELAEALLAELLLQSPEGRAGEDLLIQPVGGRAPGARADGEGHPADLGHRAEQLLQYRLAEEAGGSGDEEGLPRESFGDQSFPDSREAVSRVAAVTSGEPRLV